MTELKKCAYCGGRKLSKYEEYRELAESKLKDSALYRIWMGQLLLAIQSVTYAIFALIEAIKDKTDAK